MTLDALDPGCSARITAIDWSLLIAEEAQRLQAMGLCIGTEVAMAHCGVFGGRDPIAIRVGRMTMALRRAHARVMQVEAL
jgi:ferrous iron transport protein A